MSISDPVSDEPMLPLDLVRLIDKLCDEFETQLSSVDCIQFDGFLQRVPDAGRVALLRELCEVALDYLRQLGTPDATAVVLRQNVHLVEELGVVLASLDTKPSPPEEGRTLDFTPSAAGLTPGRRRSRGLHIRCPHCSNDVELLADTPYDSINCTVCGSAFSLVDSSDATMVAAALEKIDRFELVSRLGVGGFGTVWKARDIELDRVVAVKIPRRGQLSAAESEQFLREARAAAQLRHPNIVSVHEVGRDGDNLFIVSDLIRGVTLADWLSGHRPTPREAAALCSIVADALDHAHHRGVIHRDLKPSNIMLDGQNQPHLLDFGLAKRGAGEVAMTADGQVLGTPAYMSPEQARGEANIVDRRTDIYSFGVILFELLSGELPFRGNFQMQVHQRQTEDAPNLRSLNRTIPKDLATICAKCLERAPGARYDTAKEVAEELHRFLNGEAIRARPLSRPELAVRWAQRKPALATIVVLGALLAIGGPATAILIERQRLQLDRRLTEINELIQRKAASDREFSIKTGESRRTIERLSGQSTSWDYWPPDPQQPPHKQQLAALLAISGPTLERAAADNTAGELSRARARLTLAILHESAGNLDEAQRQFSQAANLLESARGKEPTSRSIAAALAETYQDLSRVDKQGSEASRTWLAKAAAIRRELANQAPAEAAALATLLDIELRLAVTAGADQVADALASAEELDQRLKKSLPTDPLEAYRLASQLARRDALLDDLPRKTP